MAKLINGRIHWKWTHAGSAGGTDDAQIGADARSLRALVSSRRRFDLRRNRGLNVPYRTRVMNNHFPDAVQ